MNRLRKRGILVVEDIDDLRELFAEVLTNEGYHAIMARTGVEAFARMSGVLPDLVLTDLMMPEMNGAELVQRMREHPRLRSIPVILLTSQEPTKVIEKLGQDAKTVQEILHKPVNLGELLAAVEQALGEAPAGGD